MRVKIISLNKIKSTPISWSHLNPVIKTPLAPTPFPSASPTKQVANAIITPLPEGSIEEQSTDQLAETLSKKMGNIKTLSLEEVEKNIEMANEIINREPNSFSAFKAKLISLLVLESKFNQSVDDYELNSVLDKLASFEITNGNLDAREATLIATTNNQLTVLENKLDEISLIRDEVSTQSAALDKTSPEYFTLQMANEELAMREQMAAENLEQYQETINNRGLPPTYFSEDIVEIPFLRLMSKNDYDTVRENAQSFIEQFPESPTGYFYLIKALEAEGRTQDIIQVIADSKLTPEAQSILQDRLEASNGEDPKRYWEKLNF